MRVFTVADLTDWKRSFLFIALMERDKLFLLTHRLNVSQATELW